jgi:hypothetical protein
MKEGDIVTVFGNPVKCEQPIDQARLIKKVNDLGICEEWTIEYTNEEGHRYNALIKKDAQ